MGPMLRKAPVSPKQTPNPKKRTAEFDREMCCFYWVKDVIQVDIQGVDEDV